MNPLVRARLFVIRRPWVYWVAVAAIAVTSGLVVRSRLQTVETARATWGDTRLVWVADRELDVGELAVASLQEVPEAVVPAAAIPADADLGVVRQRIGAGEMLVGADLAVGNGPASLADPGEVVVAVDDPLVTAAEPGAAVAIYAEGLVLADDARVVMVTDGIVHVAVDEGEAPVVAAAASTRTASLGFIR